MKKPIEKRRKRISRASTFKGNMSIAKGKFVELPYVLFGQAIADCRENIGMTQQELANRLEVSRTNIANVEAGRQRVLLADVLAYAAALKVTPVSLFQKAIPS
jgi:DNA-binding XRE family transcriptional regulator